MTAAASVPRGATAVVREHDATVWDLPAGEATRRVSDRTRETTVAVGRWLDPALPDPVSFYVWGVVLNLGVAAAPILWTLPWIRSGASFRGAKGWIVVGADVLFLPVMAVFLYLAFLCAWEIRGRDTANPAVLERHALGWYCGACVAVFRDAAADGADRADGAAAVGHRLIELPRYRETLWRECGYTKRI